MRPQIVIEAVDPASMMKLYRQLEAKIDAAEGEGIVQRWEFGKKLQFFRGDKKQFPKDYIEQLAQELGKSKAELYFRVQFAEKCETKAKLSNTLESYPSWYQVVNEFLVGKAPGTYSQSNEWYTPEKYIKAVRNVLGAIDLDPASCTQANRTVGAAKFYAEEDDGLDQPWNGRVWLNPPWGKLTEPFIKKLVAEFEAQEVVEAIALVNAHATDTSWFQPLWNYTLCFTDHRIDYNAPTGKEKTTTSTHGSVFVYFGKNEVAFGKMFSQFGPIVKKVV